MSTAHSKMILPSELEERSEMDSTLRNVVYDESDTGKTWPETVAELAEEEYRLRRLLDAATARTNQAIMQASDEGLTADELGSKSTELTVSSIYARRKRHRRVVR